MSAAQQSKTEREPHAGRRLQNVVYGLFATLVAAVAVAGFVPEIKTAITRSEGQSEKHSNEQSGQQSESGSSETRDPAPEQSSKNESQAQKQTTLVLALYAFFLPIAIVLLVLLALAFKFHPASWHIFFRHYKPHQQ